jgi:hypothetical protein
VTRFAALAAVALLGSAAAAHEVRPALLELVEVDGRTWDLDWRVPASGGERLALSVRLPADCADASPRRAGFAEAIHAERWRARCEADLAGREVAIDGLSATVTDVLVRITRADGTSVTLRAVPSEPTVRVPVAPGARGVAGSYLALGIEHILLGVDHLLFVFALILLVRGARRLVATVTAFTAAHSLTLALATLGWVRVPGPPVEAAIALSIVFLAREILRSGDGPAGLAERRPWAVAFVFGLLHGLGFAGALAEVGLPQRAIPVALLFFNVGVEVGQLAFIGAVLGLRAALRPIAPRAAEATPLAAYAIGAIAAFWTVERVAGFFG